MSTYLAYNKIDAPDPFDAEHFNHLGTIKFEKCGGSWSGTSDSELSKALRAQLNAGLTAGFYDAKHFGATSAEHLMLRVYWAASNECTVDMFSAVNGSFPYAADVAVEKDAEDWSWLAKGNDGTHHNEDRTIYGGWN